MAEKNGPIVTIGIEVWAGYTCSACGKEDRLPDTAKVTGTTASILALRRAGKDRDLGALLPGGIAGAGLSCRCGCGHREPWARMGYGKLDKLWSILLIALAALSVGTYLLHTGEGPLTLALLSGIGACLLSLGGLTLGKALHRRAMLKKLSTLPKTALPRLELRKPETT